MKEFFKTITGKTVLFICCVLTINIFVVSIVSEMVMIEENFYFKSKEDVVSRFIDPLVADQLTGSLYSNSEIDEMARSVLNYDYEIIDQNGEIVSSSLEGQQEWENSILYPGSGYTINYSLKDPFDTTDDVSIVVALLNVAYEMRYSVYLISIVSLIIFIFNFVSLLNVTGRREQDDKFYPGPIFNIPFDLVFGVSIIIIFFLLAFVITAFDSDMTFVMAPIFFCIVIFCECILLGLCVTFTGRIKEKTIIKNNIIYYIIELLLKVIKGIWDLLMQIPLAWQSIVAFTGITFFEFICYQRGDDFLFLIEKLVVFILVLYMAICLRKLKKASDALANGNLSYQTDTSKMVLELKSHGENLNKIADGMNLAIADRVKSEKMKTELITNVSHDLKTPLTSIVNYASLIANEHSENKKINEYSEVLVRQSSKLKRLIEDLIEASKASTGNLEVKLDRCDANVFLMQALGEYDDKLKDKNLKLVTSPYSEPLMIMADGRRMWRVFDNLMNNICKYSLENTRVYISLDKVGNNAVFIFKNTSREQLNISEDELMERFTRGDKSRNTEGNGLGLSIAKSMAELQNGSLKLDIDGDLFKAILSFPICS